MTIPPEDSFYEYLRHCEIVSGTDHLIYFTNPTALLCEDSSREKYFFVNDLCIYSMSCQTTPTHYCVISPFLFHMEVMSGTNDVFVHH
uniref:Uncharacterized protein n=1 Tax=Onchocerca volvulus TaxID=6282 RepID=A0A8R1XYI8_ONCVO